MLVAQDSLDRGGRQRAQERTRMVEHGQRRHLMADGEARSLLACAGDGDLRPCGTGRSASGVSSAAASKGGQSHRTAQVVIRPQHEDRIHGDEPGDGNQCANGPDGLAWPGDRNKEIQAPRTPPNLLCHLGMTRGGGTKKPEKGGGSGAHTHLYRIYIERTSSARDRAVFRASVVAPSRIPSFPLTLV